MFKKLDKRGFTLAELLIVVAIIGVLVAISIPIFTTQLEKAREGTDIANLRSAYAAAQVEAMTGDLGLIAADGSGSAYYNPGVDGSLEKTGGITIGQGTKTDGKSDVSSLTGVIKYTTSTVANGTKIKVTWADGAVSEVAFETATT